MDAMFEQFNANMQRDDQTTPSGGAPSFTNTANQNEENRINAMNLLGFNECLNNLWQLYRDKTAWAMQISENGGHEHNAAMQAPHSAELIFVR